MSKVIDAAAAAPRASRPRVTKSKLGTSPTARTTKPPKSRRSSACSSTESEVSTRVHDVLCREIAFIHSAEFNHKSALQRILTEPLQPASGVETKPTPSMATHQELSAYFASLYEHGLLTPEQEVALFRRMNYLKFRANALRSTLKPSKAEAAIIDEIEALLSEARKVRDEIITANLRLVVSLARKFAGGFHSFEDLLSEGNLTLIRAIEKFDYSRGFRFSTYATLAIRHDFFRLIKRQQKESARLEAGVDDLVDSSQDDEDEDLQAAEAYRRYQTLLNAMESNLDDRDKRIVMLRFGIDQEDGPQTLQTIGQHLGLSKERVRQLEIRAIALLKQHLEGNP